MSKSTIRDIHDLFSAWAKQLCLIAGLMLGLASLGCQRLQLPAIDPNGRCLFLPFPNTTELTLPRLHSQPGQDGFFPTPAYQAPSAPPACIDGSCEPAGMCNLFKRKHECLEKIHDHFRSPGKAGQLQMTPMRVVAPVGGEVVLLAGICGEDGYLVKREPIEWMLSPDSVGQIIQVNDDSPGKLTGLLHPHRPKVEKLDVDFAKGRTSSKTQLIDRGTPNCNDDIRLREGETWISVSSPTPGISRLTALAPESNIWDRRRQTAVIYWLDAQWEFPAPQIVKSDQRMVLRTKVTKAEGFVPATGWVVQYTIEDPAIATFAGPPNAVRVDERTIRVPVDQDGFGFAELAAVPGAIGTTPVTVSVISPAQPSENIPELTVGSGQTFATFSAAGLQLQIFGPESVTKGERVTFVATLANPGDIDAENTRLTLALPPGLRLIEASLQPSSLTDIAAVWDQGVLPANRQLDVSVHAQAVTAGTFDVTFEGVAAGVNPTRKTIRTLIIEPTVDVRFAASEGISQAAVGDTVMYEIDVKNTGPQTLTNLTLKVKSSPGLVEASQQDNEVEQTINVLQPGESVHIGLPFQVQQEGQQQAVLQVLSGNTIAAEKTATILGLPPRQKRPAIGVDIVFPAESPENRSLIVGQTYTALVTLRNSGEVTLTNLNIQITSDGNLLEFTQVDLNNRPVTSGGGGNVLWTPGNLLPGEQGERIRELRLFVQARAAAPMTKIDVLATAAEGVQSNASAQVEIRDPLGSPNGLPGQPGQPGVGSVQPPNNNSVLPAPPTTPDIADNAPLAGKLNISLNHLNDPEVVGREIRYIVQVTNNSNRENRRVQIELRLPEGADLVGVSSMGSEVRWQFSQGRVLLPVVEFLRRNEPQPLTYMIVLRSRIPQKMRVEASVRSDLFPNAETAAVTSTIIPAN